MKFTAIKYIIVIKDIKTGTEKKYQYGSQEEALKYYDIYSSSFTDSFIYLYVLIQQGKL